MLIIYLMVKIYYDGQSNETVGYAQIAFVIVACAAMLIPIGIGISHWSKYHKWAMVRFKAKI